MCPIMKFSLRHCQPFQIASRVIHESLVIGGARFGLALVLFDALRARNHAYRFPLLRQQRTFAMASSHLRFC